MENDVNKKMICADCGKEYDASEACCPVCGLPASGVMPKVKMTEISKIANWLERSDCPDEAREIRLNHPEIQETQPEEHRKHVTPCLWRKDSTPSAALVSDCFKSIRRVIAVVIGVFLIALAKQLFVL